MTIHSLINHIANHHSKDQDYRNASVEDKVSSTISIIGIPKTATMEQVITFRLCSFPFPNVFTIQLSFVFDPQILGAFADHDGAPMQGMKIKSVVPGKTAFILF